MSQAIIVHATGTGGIKIPILISRRRRDLLTWYNMRWWIDTNGYVYAPGNTKRKRVWLHRLLMGSPMNMIVDHIDGNILNNTRSNLRMCTKQQNNWNRPAAKKTGLPKHVYRYRGKYYVKITCNRRQRHIGTYATLDEATAVATEIGKDFHGNFACTWIRRPTV